MPARRQPRHSEEGVSQTQTQTYTQAQTQSPTQHKSKRNRHASPSTSDDEGPNKNKIPEADMQLMVKNLVRMALACEYTRVAIRREDVPKKVFVNDHKRCFGPVFKLAQERLKSTFGMEMVELPAKDRRKAMTMTQQRKAAHSQAGTNGTTSTAKSGKSWILRNLLPPELKQISQRQHMTADRNYNAVVMVLIIVVVMSDEQCCSENRAISVFERLHWFPTTPVGSFEEVVAKMTRQGYIERIKDDQSTDGAHNLYIGPRGKVETLQNRDELFSVISKIYGHDDDEAAQERLRRIIEDTIENVDETIDGEEEDEDEQETQIPEDTGRRSKKSRRSQVYED